jgi:hypothetical protein
MEWRLSGDHANYTILEGVMHVEYIRNACPYARCSVSGVSGGTLALKDLIQQESSSV